MSATDLPVGWVTFFLALATIALAVFAYFSSRDTMKLTELSSAEVKTLKEQTQILKDQFEVSVKPVIKIFPAASVGSNPFSQIFDVVVQNIGGGIAIDVSVSVTPEAGGASVRWDYPTIAPGSQERITTAYNPATPATWRVTITGAKDVLGRPMPDRELSLRYPSSPQPPPSRQPE